MAVAKSLLANGIGCTVVEREKQLGGRVRDWACMATNQCLRCFCCSLGDLVEEIDSFSNARVMKGAGLSSANVFEGGIRVGVRSSGGDTDESVGG